MSGTPSLSSSEEPVRPSTPPFSQIEGTVSDSESSTEISDEDMEIDLKGDPPLSADGRKLPERVGSLRNLTKQLSIPNQMGALPLSPGPKRKSIRRLSMNSALPRSRSNSPGPLLSGVRDRRRNGGSKSPTPPLTRSSSERFGTGGESGLEKSPGALGIIGGEMTTIIAQERLCSRSPGALARTSRERFRSGGSPGPLGRGMGRTRSGEGLRASLGRTRSGESLQGNRSPLNLSRRGSLSSFHSRSLRSQRRLSLARKNSSKTLLATGPVSILRRGKFSQPKASTEEEDEKSLLSNGEASQDESISFRIGRKLSMRTTRVSFWFPDEASVAESFATDDGSMQLMDLYMDDGDDGEMGLGMDHGRSFREAVPFIDSLDGDGYGKFGELDLNDCSDHSHDLMINAFHNSTIQEELGASFSKGGWDQSFSSLLTDTDEDSHHLGSIREVAREISPEDNVKQCLRVHSPPVAPAFDGSLTSPFSESPVKSKNEVKDNTPTIANFKKMMQEKRTAANRSPPPSILDQGSVSSLLSEESLHIGGTDKDSVGLTTFEDAVPTQNALGKEGSTSSESSAESPVGVDDFEK